MYNLFKNYKKFLKKYKFDIFMNDLGTNKLLIGVFMIFMNIGSRYIELKLTKGQEMILKNIAREILIFTIAFVVTVIIVKLIQIPTGEICSVTETVFDYTSPKVDIITIM